MSQEVAEAARAPQPPFAGSRVLIYGAAQGIGRAVALEFARRGADVAVADIDLSGARETAALAEGLGGRAAAIACDVTDRASVHAAAAEAEKALGELDIVMNNVGAITNGNPEDLPVEEWRRIIDLNLWSVIYSNEVFVPKFLQRGRGHIVNTASFAGLYPYAASRMPYVASKAAVIGLSESLALYLEPQGVRVSVLCPGPVMTNVMGAMRSFGENVPLRGPGGQFRVMRAEEAAVVLADGMRDGRIVIPTDEKVWEVVQRHAASPDDFIRSQIDAFARGDLGRPSM
jgi:NAD(P)-dependent dehydrogenase (short-subunit alcohol dehydrogenase family)